MPYADLAQRKSYAKKYYSRWRKLHPEKVKAACGRWYKKNGKKYGRKWRAANKEAVSGYQRSYYYRNKNSRAANVNKWRKAHPGKWSSIRRKAAYGITRADYLQLRKEQRGCCAICKKKMFSLRVDHCHSSGKIRGLLCVTCNLMLGHAKDSIKILRAGISYLS